MNVKSTEISLQFKVWCPNLNRIRSRLYLLGSLPELGAWNIYDAIEAYPTADNHTWQVDVIVPVASSFEWVWVKTGQNRTSVEWERTSKRNRNVGYFSGVLHTIWGETEEVYLQAATFAEVTTFIKVDDGHTLVLTGSTHTTGLWDMNKAVQAREFPKKSGYWKANVSFDALTNLYFQWAVVKEKNMSVVRTQEKVTHSISGRRCWMRVVAPWMLPVAVIVDLSIINDTLDNVGGRTSVIVSERLKRNQEIVNWNDTWNTRYSATSKQPLVSSSLDEVNRAKVNDITNASSVELIQRQPAVRSHENLDDLIKRNQEKKSTETDAEWLTKQLSENYTEHVQAIKGQGQTEVMVDPINTDELVEDLAKKKPRRVKHEERAHRSDTRHKQLSVVVRGEEVSEAGSRTSDMRQVHFSPYSSDAETSYDDITTEEEGSLSDVKAATSSLCWASGSSSSSDYFPVSDTGFTEMTTAHWHCSEPTRTCQAAPTQRDTHWLNSDFDEGFSDAETTLVCNLDRELFENWGASVESSAVLDKNAFTCLAEGNEREAILTDPASENSSSAEDEHFDHLEWLADKVQREDGTLLSELGIGAKTTGAFRDFAATLNDIIGSLGSSGNDPKWVSPPPGSDFLNDVYFLWRDNGDRARISRDAARDMEQRWGAGLQALPESSAPGRSLYRRREASFYDMCDLREAAADQLGINDRRAVAREVETLWCQMTT